jgi:uncharacterized phiE125 gp8 family phage protein
MDLTVLLPPDPGELPVAAFRAQLRLGTGFADSATQDAELAGFLAAAIAVIEARTAKALLTRRLRLVVDGWRWLDAQALPLAPVAAVLAVTLRDRTGAAQPVDPARWRLRTDRHRPQVVATGAMLPAVPSGGTAEIDFDAGFGAAWSDVPADLAQAVLLLAAEHYHARSGVRPDLPPAVAGLVAAWELVRLTAGGHRG